MGKEEETLKSVLLEGSPILFLGAGFSAGAQQKDKKAVPGGWSLKEDYLIPEVLKYEKGSPEYREAMTYSLSKLCNYIDNIGYAKEKNDLLVRIFKDVIPSEDHRAFFRYYWRKIYTTNIDDLVENVFKNTGKALYVQNSRIRVNFQQKNQPGACEYLKLHGCVNNEKEGFTFSTKEYVTSMQTREDYRFNEFCRDIQFENFIFIGTAFDEINIDYFLQLYENAGYSSRGQLFFINPHADMELKGRIKKMNGILLEWDWKKLMEFIEQIDFSAVDQKKYWKQRMQLKHFYDISYYEKLYHENLAYRSDLYYGKEPIMFDILADWDFVHPQGKLWVREIADRTSSACITLTGKRMNGKTCVGMRLLYELKKAGFEVFDYATPSFDGQMILDYIQHSDKEKFAFLLDEGAYYYRAIRDTLRRYKGDKIIIFLVCTSLKNHHKWRYYLQRTAALEKRLDSSISEEYSEEILNKLRIHGHLGRLGGMDEKARKEELMETDDLMTFLMTLTDNDGFWHRYETVVRECIEEKEEYKRFFALLLLFDLRDLPYVPSEDVTLLFGRMTADMLNHTTDLYQLYHNMGYRIRGRKYGSGLISMVSNEMMINEIEAFCRIISSQVSEYDKNYSKNIMESLIKPKEIYKRFSFTEGQKKSYKEMLYRLQTSYENISYYWIQLGLAEQLDGDYNRALTHFQHAKSIRPGSYSVLHAIARNYIRQANDMAGRDVKQAQRTFEKGEKQMLSLICEQEYEQNMPYSIHTYLLEKIEFCRKISITPSTAELKEMLRLCQELEKKDIREVSEPVKRKLFRYLKEINRQDVLGRISLQDLGLFLEGAEESDIMPEDPELD